MTITINKTDVWNTVKRNLAILIVGIVFLILYFFGCNNKGKGGVTTHDTVTNTVQVLQPPVYIPQYQPQQTGQTVYIPIPQNVQPVVPSSTIEGLTAQVRDLNATVASLATVAKDYYATRNYKDSIQLKDTAGVRVGVVNLDDVVSENQIKFRRPSYQLYFPHTTTTITNTTYAGARNQWFIGIGATSYPNSGLIDQAKVGIQIKNKTDALFGIAGTYKLKKAIPTQTSFGVEVSLYKKISLKFPSLKQILTQ